MNKILFLVVLVCTFNVSAQPKLIDASIYIPGTKDYLKSSDPNNEKLSEKNRQLQSVTKEVTTKNSQTEIYDSIYNWKWDKSRKGWKIYSKTEYAYDKNKGNYSSYITTVYDDIYGPTIKKHVFQYNDNNTIESEIIQKWYLNSWMNESRDDFSYNENNQVIEQLNQLWTGEKWGWCFKYLKTYNSENEETSNAEQVWVENTWKTNNRDTTIYSFNQSVNQLVKLNQTWINNQWQNFSQTITDFDSKNNVINSIYNQCLGNTWFYSTQFENTYDNFNNLTSYIENCGAGSNSVLSPYLQCFITYNDYGKETERTCQKWIDNNWVKYIIETTNYDNKKSTICKSTKKWNDEGAEIISGDSICYFLNEEHTSINKYKSPDNDISIYPNPNNGKFKLFCKTPVNTVEIYNSRGIKIYSIEKFNKVSSLDFDLSNQVKGLWFIKINSGSDIQTKKVMVY
jgi:hypothetical protein